GVDSTVAGRALSGGDAEGRGVSVVAGDAATFDGVVTTAGRAARRRWTPTKIPAATMSAARMVTCTVGAFERTVVGGARVVCSRAMFGTELVLARIEGTTERFERPVLEATRPTRSTRAASTSDPNGASARASS